MSWYEEAEKDIKGSVEDIEEGRLAVMILRPEKRTVEGNHIKRGNYKQ